MLRTPSRPHFMHSNDSPTSLAISNTSLTDEMRQTMSARNDLRSIKITNVELCDADIQLVAKALTKNPLIMLVLNNNQIGDEGACVLAKALEKHSTLQLLTLSNNQIGDPGAVALAHALRHNTTLAQLHLNANPIGEGGRASLTQVLTHNADVTIHCTPSPPKEILPSTGASGPSLSPLGAPSWTQRIAAATEPEEEEEPDFFSL